MSAPRPPGGSGLNGGAAEANRPDDSETGSNYENDLNDAALWHQSVAFADCAEQSVALGSSAQSVDELRFMDEMSLMDVSIMDDMSLTAAADASDSASSLMRASRNVNDETRTSSDEPRPSSGAAQRSAEKRAVAPQVRWSASRGNVAKNARLDRHAVDLDSAVDYYTVETVDEPRTLGRTSTRGPSERRPRRFLQTPFEDAFDAAAPNAAAEHTRRRSVTPPRRAALAEMASATTFDTRPFEEDSDESLFDGVESGGYTGETQFTAETSHESRRWQVHLKPRPPKDGPPRDDVTNVSVTLRLLYRRYGTSGGCQVGVSIIRWSSFCRDSGLSRNKAQVDVDAPFWEARRCAVLKKADFEAGRTNRKNGGTAHLKRGGIALQSTLDETQFLRALELLLAQGSAPGLYEAPDFEARGFEPRHATRESGFVPARRSALEESVPRTCAFFRGGESREVLCLAAQSWIEAPPESRTRRARFAKTPLADALEETLSATLAAECELLVQRTALDVLEPRLEALGRLFSRYARSDSQNVTLSMPQLQAMLEAWWLSPALMPRRKVRELVSTVFHRDGLSQLSFELFVEVLSHVALRTMAGANAALRLHALFVWLQKCDANKTHALFHDRGNAHRATLPPDARPSRLGIPM
ncbi:hypothetical protein M885DRAFT_627067 [Pelagophyceae sp. CCMP2097]|nr:hypothetical protein M885DRAFT_627067 [Pelagophyceae sp. CCMP2097]